MSRSQVTLSPPEDDYVELTNSDAAELSFQVKFGVVELRATADATKPDADAVGVEVSAPIGDFGITMDKLFPSGGMKRLWGKSVQFQSLFWIDHA